MAQNTNSARDRRRLTSHQSYVSLQRLLANSPKVLLSRQLKSGEIVARFLRLGRKGSRKWINLPKTATYVKNCKIIPIFMLQLRLFGGKYVYTSNPNQVGAATPTATQIGAHRPLKIFFTLSLFMSVPYVFDVHEALLRLPYAPAPHTRSTIIPKAVPHDFSAP